MNNFSFNNERPDSFLGYYVEAPRALYHIVSDDSIGKVRIENLDDISIFDYNGRIQKLEQVKYNYCKRTHGLIICSTWFDFFWQLVFNAFLVFIYTALLVCIYNFNEIVRFDNYINLIKTGVNFELLFL